MIHTRSLGACHSYCYAVGLLVPRNQKKSSDQGLGLGSNDTGIGILGIGEYLPVSGDIGYREYFYCL